MDYYDWVDALEPAQSDPASWTVVGDDDITEAKVERGDGSDAERHSGGFQSSDPGRRWTGLHKNALCRYRSENLELDKWGIIFADRGIYRTEGNVSAALCQLQEVRPINAAKMNLGFGFFARRTVRRGTNLVKRALSQVLTS